MRDLVFWTPKEKKEIVLPSIQKYIVETNPGCDLYAHTYDVNTVPEYHHKEAQYGAWRPGSSA
jgi:hypothetical protein